MMKSDRCIEELENIIEIEGISGRNGVLARREALKRWVDEWVVELKNSQPVIKTNLTSEEEDFIKYHLATRLGDSLMESCVSVNREKNLISTRILALKR